MNMWIKLIGVELALNLSILGIFHQRCASHLSMWHKFRRWGRQLIGVIILWVNSSTNWSLCGSVLIPGQCSLQTDQFTPNLAVKRSFSHSFSKRSSHFCCSTFHHQRQLKQTTPRRPLWGKKLRPSSTIWPPQSASFRSSPLSLAAVGLTTVNYTTWCHKMGPVMLCHVILSETP